MIAVRSHFCVAATTIALLGDCAALPLLMPFRPRRLQCARPQRLRAQTPALGCAGPGLLQRRGRHLFGRRDCRSRQLPRRQAGAHDEGLYLDPLLSRVKANGGRVYRDGPPLTLLVDIKTDGVHAYEVLAERLARYADMLTVVRDGQVQPGAVTIIISGDRAVERIAADKVAMRALTAG